MRSRIASLVLAAAVAAASAPASASTLIGFTDVSTTGVTSLGLSHGGNNWLASWSQTVGVTSATLSVVVGSPDGGGAANWWLTDKIGPDADPDVDVVASGTFTTPSLSGANSLNFNSLTPTVLATGLSLGPGDYFLVLDGPSPKVGLGEWVGDSTQPSVTLAPGFTLGAYAFTGSAQDFGPGATFTTVSKDAPLTLAFSLEGKLASTGAPEPAAWALMLAGFALTGAALRRRGALAT